MEYQSVSARFLFFNGKKRYTVEYCYGLNKWYVFNEEEVSGSVYSKENKTVKWAEINRNEAEDVLYEYMKNI